MQKQTNKKIKDKKIEANEKKIAKKASARGWSEIEGEREREREGSARRGGRDAGRAVGLVLDKTCRGGG